RLSEAAAWQAEADRIISALSVYDDVLDSVQKLIVGHRELLLLLQNLKGRDKDAQYIKKIISAAERIAQTLRTIQMMLATTPYPFKHGNQQATIGHYAVEIIPDKRDINGILGQ